MKLFGIIGNPLDHSLSPKIFNALFKKKRLPFRYLSFQVEKNHLKNLVRCMKLCDIEGLNVTAPFKEAVIPHLDGLDPFAKQCGAVNTIVRQKNRFVGFNTDGPGFVWALKEKAKVLPKNKTVLLIGAGGAARGIAAALAANGAKKIIVFNRHPLRAKKMGQHLKKYFPKTIWQTLPLAAKKLKTVLPQTNLLIQTTPSLLALPISLLSQEAIVCDILYGKGETKLLKAAKKRRLKTVNGLSLLHFQILLNQKLWGLPPFPLPGRERPSPTR